MTIINNNIKWIMLISGLITCSMFQAFFSPSAGLMTVFGSSIDSPVAEVVIRNWGALIGLVGLMLIFGAFKPHSRALILLLAIVSKAIFIGLVLTFGSDYLETAITAVVFDSAVVLLYILYLIDNRKTLNY